MSANKKKRLIDSLTEAHISTRAALEGVDLEMPVYKDTGWRIRDIVGHIATWDQEMANSLQAYKEGSEYLTPDLDEEEVEFNDKAVMEQRKLSTEEILKEFESSYHAFKNGILEIPNDQFPGDLVYPWGDERGDIATMVGYMIDHAIEHRDEINEAIKSK